MESNRALRAVIVEDEEAPRQLLRRMLERRHADAIEVVAEATSGPEALSICEAHQPDVIFLDLNLPGFGGFELLSQLRLEAHIVITTADSQHAVEAYRANAVDYLLKPVDPEQLKEAIGRVVAAIKSERLVRLLCRERDTTKVVHLNNVLFLCTEEGYTRVQTEDAYHLLSEPLASIAERLPENFVRAHRNAIVNVRHVNSLEQESALLGRRGFNVPVSRRHFRELRRRLMFTE